MAKGFLTRILEAKWAEKIAGSLSIPAERRLQQSFDYEKLALYTALYAISKGDAKNLPPPAAYQKLVMQMKSQSSNHHAEMVNNSVMNQIVHAAQTLHEALQQAGDATPAAATLQKLLRHKPQNTTSSTDAPVSTRKAHQHSRQLGVHDVSQLLQARMGYSLGVGPSSIQHPQAGLGVFMKGTACVGSVVALVPGLFFSRTQLSRMPHYPQISLNNPYLSSRYDMSIIDSQPWHQAYTSHTQHDASSSRPHTSPAIASRETNSMHSTMQPLNPKEMTGYDAARWALQHGLETRHPLAVGHLINHPPPGQQPNVLEVSVDMPWPVDGLPAWLRAYVPCLPGCDVDTSHGSVAKAVLPIRDSEDDDTDDEDERKTQKNVVPEKVTLRGLALVATRTIRDGEELFQNYRMNPALQRPDWYVTVDEQEERRRWAPLWYAKLM